MPLLKKPLKRLLMFFVSNQTTRSLMRTFGIHHLKIISDFRNHAETLAKEIQITQVIQKRLEDAGLRVMTGPFAELKYPSFASCGSTLIPKLLGTYEKELHESIERMISKEPPIVIDVGCAEGYYAVGMAIRCKHSRIFAYDTDPTARGRCARMAGLNQVADRVLISGKCDPETLAAHDFSKGGLVIADCEGYEKYLFSKAIAKSLSGADLIIELHEYLDRAMGRLIAEIFSETHDLTLVQSIPDIEKARTYESDLLLKDDLDERMLAFAEGRCEVMNWAVLSPK
jgi:precorrin-6B methylase 2